MGFHQLAIWGISMVESGPSAFGQFSILACVLCRNFWVDLFVGIFHGRTFARYRVGLEEPELACHFFGHNCRSSSASCFVCGAG